MASSDCASALCCSSGSTSPTIRPPHRRSRPFIFLPSPLQQKCLASNVSLPHPLPCHLPFHTFYQLPTRRLSIGSYSSSRIQPLLLTRAQRSKSSDRAIRRGGTTTQESGSPLSTPEAANADAMLGPQGDIECIGTGTDVECVIPDRDDNVKIGSRIATRAVNIRDPSSRQEIQTDLSLESSSELTSLVSGTQNSSELKSLEVERAHSFDKKSLLNEIWETLLLISPFFFWGTAMVAMKGVLPKAGPLFVAATRLIPSGMLLLVFAHYKGRKQPSGLNAWLAIALFGLVDASCFQGFLAEGLKRTSAGLGSVIIDSQPLTVAVLASILFGETIGSLGIVGLATGVIGLLLLEVPVQVIEDFFKGQGFSSLSDSTNLSNSLSQENTWTVWDSGEWWMLLAAQSMAVGTVMVRWVSQFSDPIMATGWHMILGGLPLLALSAIQQDPALNGHIQDLQIEDWLALLYTSVFGSAISYGVFFYNATRGSLTKLSSLTFLTPMFAAFFGYLFLDETLTPIQLFGALVTLASIYLVNTRVANAKDSG